MPQIIGGWWQHRQTANAPEDFVSERASIFHQSPCLSSDIGGFVMLVVIPGLTLDPDINFPFPLPLLQDQYAHCTLKCS